MPLVTDFKVETSQPEDIVINEKILLENAYFFDADGTKFIVPRQVNFNTSKPIKCENLSFKGKGIVKGVEFEFCISGKVIEHTQSSMFTYKLLTDFIHIFNNKFQYKLNTTSLQSYELLIDASSTQEPNLFLQTLGIKQ